jgi:hypothetical protein
MSIAPPSCAAEGTDHGRRKRRAGYARDLLRAVRLAPFARDLEVRVAVRLSALPRGVVLRAARLVRLYSLRASFALARASLSVRATLPPAVGARGSSVDLRRVVGPRAACGSDGPLRALRTQRSPCFWYSCLSAANATRCARPPSVRFDRAIVRLFPQAPCVRVGAFDRARDLDAVPAVCHAWHHMPPCYRRNFGGVSSSAAVASIVPVGCPRALVVRPRPVGAGVRRRACRGRLRTALFRSFASTAALGCVRGLPAIGLGCPAGLGHPGLRLGLAPRP